MAAPASLFRLGIQSYCYRKFSLDQAIGMAQSLRLHFIEIYPGHASHEATAAEAAAVRARLADAGMQQSAYGVVKLSNDAETLRQVFEHCRRMGVPVISADPDPAPDCFNLLERFVAEYDIRVAVHNHGARHRWSLAQQILDAIQDYDPRIGVCLDTSWAIDAGEDPAAAIRLLAPRLYGIHLKDSTGTEDVAVGTGRLDLPGTLRALRDVGFDGSFSLEYENFPEVPQPYLEQCAEATRRELARL
ncbi:MAG: sugar phosphate isomerase/epimerase [Phycisphaerae bacterium]|nr:sugar phosphate isomerase/epimerase [Phycisphaerae bacterium]